jgi:hypothetical protein
VGVNVLVAVGVCVLVGVKVGVGVDVGVGEKVAVGVNVDVAFTFPDEAAVWGIFGKARATLNHGVPNHAAAQMNINSTTTADGAKTRRLSLWIAFLDGAGDEGFSTSSDMVGLVGWVVVRFPAPVLGRLSTPLLRALLIAHRIPSRAGLLFGLISNARWR